MLWEYLIFNWISRWDLNVWFFSVLGKRSHFFFIKYPIFSYSICDVISYLCVGYGATERISDFGLNEYPISCCKYPAGTRMSNIMWMSQVCYNIPFRAWYSIFDVISYLSVGYAADVRISNFWPNVLLGPECLIFTYLRKNIPFLHKIFHFEHDIPFLMW